VGTKLILHFDREKGLTLTSNKGEMISHRADLTNERRSDSQGQSFDFIDFENDRQNRLEKEKTEEPSEKLRSIKRTHRESYNKQESRWNTLLSSPHEKIEVESSKVGCPPFIDEGNDRVFLTARILKKTVWGNVLQRPL